MENTASGMASDSDTPKKRLITRRRALGVLFGGAGVGTACAADAFLLGPKWLDVTRKEVVCPGLGGSLDGLRVGVISDIHYKPDQDKDLLVQAVDTLLAEKPDLITIVGDYIDRSPKVVEPMLRQLSRLEAPHGVFACLGNHDGWADQSGFISRSFQQHGIEFLINQHSRLQIRGESLALAATDHVWLGDPDPQRALRGIPQHVPILAMVHEPDFFDEMTTHRRIALQVSGHTHGGQCQVPVVGYAPARVAYGEKYLEGVYDRGDSRLFVTRGLGTVGLRVRFACRPEVAILTLQAEA